MVPLLIRKARRIPAVAVKAVAVILLATTMAPADAPYSDSAGMIFDIHKQHWQGPGLWPIGRSLALPFLRRLSDLSSVNNYLTIYPQRGHWADRGVNHCRP